MNSTLKLTAQVLAFVDEGTGVSNPQQTHVNWAHRPGNIDVSNAAQVPVTIPAGQSVTVFDGTRTLTVDGTTEFDIALVDGEWDLYRLSHVAGTSPGFRTDRGLDLTGDQVSVVVNANGTATFVSAANPWGAVQVGDTVWIPGTDELPAQPFHIGNQGFWVVIAAAAGQLVMTRGDENFMAANESNITVVSADDFQAFTSSGVQIGDKLELLAGFVPSSRRTFVVTAVTPDFIEFASTLAIPPEEGIIPTAAGISVYTAAKRFLWLELDQEATVRVNGDAGSTQRVTPWVAADQRAMGVYARTGPTWKLIVVNLSTSTLHGLAISVE